MAQTKYTDSGVNPLTNLYAAAEMLKAAKVVMVLDKTGSMKQMPKNKTDTIAFRRPVVFTPADTPLQEGVTPTAHQFEYESVQATLRQYGEVVEVTDWADDLAENEVIRDAAEQCGDNIGRTMERLNYGVVKAGSSVFYANGSARNAVNSTITTDRQHAVTRFLKAQKAQKFTRVLSGSPNYATKPIEASYLAVTHTDMERDIRRMDGFVPTSEYGQKSIVSEYEIGAVMDVRYILSPDLPAFADAGAATSTMISTSGTNADVYPILYFGKDAWASVALAGKDAISPTIIRPGQIDKSDPLGQRGMIGWKTYHTALILNEMWMVRLEASATDL